MEQMFSNTFFLLAQAGVPAPSATAGQAISGFLVVLTMSGSLAMMVVWVLRFRQTGHALPAAGRGVLRVPVPLTLTAIGLSLLMISLSWLMSVYGVTTDPEGEIKQVMAAEVTSRSGDQAPEDSVTPKAPPDSDTQASNGNTDPDQSANATEDKAGSEGESTDDPVRASEQMQTQLNSLMMMDLFLLLILGGIVVFAQHLGRVRLPENGMRTGFAADVPVPAVLSEQQLWPDLDDAAAAGLPPSELSMAQREFRAEADSADQSSPYSVPVLPQFQVPEPPVEAFSLFTELRYAAEIFLAAYVPTTFIRVIVVLITMSIQGEEPDQHPLLDMLNSGAGLEIMAMIFLAVVVMAPIVEELQFRVIILGGLAQFGNPMLALGLSSFLFAFAHGFPDSVALLPLAVALGYAYLRRRSYITVMLVHFLFNFFNLAIALLALT